MTSDESRSPGPVKPADPAEGAPLAPTAAKPAPAKPAGPPPPELSERGRAIAAALAKAGVLAAEPKPDHSGAPMFEVPPDEMLSVARRLRDELKITYLSCLTTLEWPETWQTTYHLYDFAHQGTLVLKTSIPKEQDTFSSVTEVWPAANWYEREAYDMFGVKFAGHPHLARILMADDWKTFPLRKDHPMDVEGGY